MSAREMINSEEPLLTRLSHLKCSLLQFFNSLAKVRHAVEILPAALSREVFNRQGHGKEL
jgi:hypothetical protein